MLWSCSKDDVTETPTQNSNPISVEEGKTILQENGITLMNEMDAFQDDPAITAIEEIAQLFQLDNLNPIDNILIGTLTNAVLVKNKKIDPAKFLKIQTITVSTPEESLMNNFNEQKGEYTWNDETQKFDKTATSSSSIVYIRNYNGKIGKLSLTNFSTANHISNNEIPTSLNINLSVNNSTVFNHSYSASISNNSYIPNNINHIINLGTLTITQKFTHTNNNQGLLENSIHINNKPLTSFTGKVIGDFAEINNTGKNTKEFIYNLLSATGTSITIMDATFTMDTKIKPDLNSLGNLSLDEQINYLNSNIDSKLLVKGQQIAKGSFIKKEYTYEDIEWLETPIINVFDFNGNKVATFNSWEEFMASSYAGNENYWAHDVFYKIVQKTGSEPEMIMIFEDGSKGDFESFFGISYRELFNNLDEIEFSNSHENY